MYKIWVSIYMKVLFCTLPLRLWRIATFTFLFVRHRINIHRKWCNDHSNTRAELSVFQDSFFLFRFSIRSVLCKTLFFSCLFFIHFHSYHSHTVHTIHCSQQIISINRFVFVSMCVCFFVDLHYNINASARLIMKMSDYVCVCAL